MWPLGFDDDFDNGSFVFVKDDLVTQTVEKQNIFQLASNGLYRKGCEKISIHEVKNE